MKSIVVNLVQQYELTLPRSSIMYLLRSSPEVAWGVLHGEVNLSLLITAVRSIRFGLMSK